ncbi:MAG: hypothetical protein QOH70_2854 [Blastocatellia bacterium]|nr:hypothetical protein [Blastocatellia bacterium]
MTHEVFIPPLTLEAFKPTVLNCFWFRQTNLIPGAAAGECAAPLDFNQQRLPWKIETVLSLYLHDELETMPCETSKRPFAADEFQMQTRNAICGDMTIPYHGKKSRLILLTA